MDEQKREAEQKTTTQKTTAKTATTEQKAKIGAGHLAAMFRQGLRELRAIFFPESNVAQPTEYGIWGTKLPSEIAADRQPKPQAAAKQEPGAASGKSHRSPSQIAAAAKSDHGQEKGGSVHGRDSGRDSAQGMATHRSPSQIAADRTPYVPPQQHDNDLSHGM